MVFVLYCLDCTGVYQEESELQLRLWLSLTHQAVHISIEQGGHVSSSFIHPQPSLHKGNHQAALTVTRGNRKANMALAWSQDFLATKPSWTFCLIYVAVKSGELIKNLVWPKRCERYYVAHLVMTFSFTIE